MRNVLSWHNEYKNYATQGPCPDGYHIPSLTEFQNLISWITPYLSGTDIQKKAQLKGYLHFPDNYYLSRSSGTINSSYWPCRYWTTYMTDKDAAYCFYIDKDSVIGTQSDKPANWFNIRPFRNVPIVPDSSWTLVVWDSSVAAGYFHWIYHNSTLWLISISNGLSGSDFKDWITIPDKNLWATVRWDSWDTVDNNNAGLYYQFWNNHGFLHSWATSFYTSAQDVTWYWPWNYYDDDHFTKLSSNGWFSSDNNNIWWWVTGNVIV